MDSFDIIAEGNNEIFQSCSDYNCGSRWFPFTEFSFGYYCSAPEEEEEEEVDDDDDDDAIVVVFEKYYPEHEDPRGQNMWIVNPFAKHRESIFPGTKPLNLLNYHRTKDRRVLSIL
jgi:hypothetical protein